MELIEREHVQTPILRGRVRHGVGFNRPLHEQRLLRAFERDADDAEGFDPLGVSVLKNPKVVFRKVRDEIPLVIQYAGADLNVGALGLEGDWRRRRRLPWLARRACLSGD